MASLTTERLRDPSFEVGTKWKHERLGHIYFIRAEGVDEKGEEVYSLGLFDPHNLFPSPFPTDMVWTAEEIAREFNPLDQKMTRWDRLMLDE